MCWLGSCGPQGDNRAGEGGGEREEITIPEIIELFG